LKKGPKNLLEFKTIADEGGLFIAD